MGGTVIQHQRSRRKRPPARAWAARRLGALAVILAGLAVATWLSLDLLSAPARVATEKTAGAPPAADLARATPQPPAIAEVNVALDLLGPPPAPRRRTQPEPAGVPLDAAIERRSDDFEILNAAELASISQARD